VVAVWWAYIACGIALTVAGQWLLHWAYRRPGKGNPPSWAVVLTGFVGFALAFAIGNIMAGKGLAGVVEPLAAGLGGCALGIVSARVTDRLIVRARQGRNADRP
jgi:hypothetical protein